VPNDVGRLGRPEEIAATVAHLASPWADYVSGAVLRVDGGTIRSVRGVGSMPRTRLITGSSRGFGWELATAVLDARDNLVAT
jgi:NAD(P)-dependent dehydrogenase (short-subunit alcohol dehydrogenase family)